MLKVSSSSDVKKVAGAISYAIRDSEDAPDILAAGGASINQAVKVAALI